MYKLPGLDSYPGGGASPSSPTKAAISGRNPSVTRNAPALNDELVDVDHRLRGGCTAPESPGSGAGGRLPPERIESVSPASLLHEVPSVMPPHDELVLGARERGEVECGRALRMGEEGMEAMSRSRMEGAWSEEAMCMPMWRRVGRGLFGWPGRRTAIFSLSMTWRLCCWR